MGSMTKKEIAQKYFEQLKKSSNKSDDLKKIYTDLDGLVSPDTGNRLDRNTKIQILDELERLIKLTPGFESIDESFSYGSIWSTTASDNSDILKVISAMKKRVG